MVMDAQSMVSLKLSLRSYMIFLVGVNVKVPKLSVIKNALVGMPSFYVIGLVAMGSE